MRGQIEALRENTAGADAELVELLVKIDRGEWRWTARRKPF